MLAYVTAEQEYFLAMRLRLRRWQVLWRMRLYVLRQQRRRFLSLERREKLHISTGSGTAASDQRARLLKIEISKM